jgi:hypothetical protein
MTFIVQTSLIKHECIFRRAMGAEVSGDAIFLRVVLEHQLQRMRIQADRSAPFAEEAGVDAESALFHIHALKQRSKRPR